MDTTTDIPRVWLGCLACYNAGRLTGEWLDVDTAADATPEDIHHGPTTHEELWVMDSEYVPMSGEFGQAACRSIADAFETIGEAQWPAFLAYADTGLGSLDSAGVTDPSGFEESYQGEWDSREDYAQELAEDLDLLPKDSAWPASYIDWTRAARDLFMDYADAPAPGGGIYVFRSI